MKRKKKSQLRRIRVRTIRDLLLCFLLAVLSVVAIEVISTIRRAGALLVTAESRVNGSFNRVDSAIDHLDDTITASQALLVSLRGTSEQIRNSAQQQLGHQEAIWRRTSDTMLRVELLVKRADEQLTGISSSTKRATDNVAELAMAAHEAVAVNSAEVSQSLSNLDNGLQTLNSRLADPRIGHLMDSLDEAGSQLAVANSNVAEATGEIRDMLSPKKASFWRKVLDVAVRALTFEAWSIIN